MPCYVFAVSSIVEPAVEAAPSGGAGTALVEALILFFIYLKIIVIRIKTTSIVDPTIAVIYKPDTAK